MSGRKYNEPDYRFVPIAIGINGQEKEDDISGSGNNLIFKYRIHDSRLGRFLSVDPLAPKYPWNSTYAFAENRVIQGIDLEGAEFKVSYMAKIDETTIVRIENSNTLNEKEKKILIKKVKKKIDGQGGNKSGYRMERMNAIWRPGA